MKKKRSTKQAEEDPLAEADPRPEVSPYTASSVKLYFRDDIPLSIPRSLLGKSPRLSSLYSSAGTLRLKDIPEDAGHVLVHFLFTDTYQCLRPKGPSAHEKLTVEFLTSIRAYAAARAYELPVLEELAKDEITRIGDGLHFPVALDLVQSAYPSPSVGDTWLNDYLKTRLQSLFKNPKELLQCVFLKPQDQTMSVSDMVVKSLLELLCENTASGQTCLNQVGASRGSIPVAPSPGDEPEAYDSAQQAKVGRGQEQELRYSDTATGTVPDSLQKVQQHGERVLELDKGEMKGGSETSGDWTIYTPSDNETDPICWKQEEHIFRGGWKQCPVCVARVRGLSRELQDE